jgi:hypothetical protein
MRRFVKICIAIISVFLVYQFIFSSGTFSAPWLFDTKYRSFYEFSKSSEKKFQSNLNSISESEALLSDLVDFNWDLACPVGPYDSAYRVLGSGLIDQSQKMTVAARATAEKKAFGHRS